MLTHRAADEIERHPVQIEYVEGLIQKHMTSGRVPGDLMYVERGPKHTLRNKTFNMSEKIVEYISAQGRGKGSYFLDSLVHEQMVADGKITGDANKKRTLKEIRTITGLGQHEFAKRLDVSPVTISKIECGALPLSYNVALKIAEKFSFSPEEIAHSPKSVQNGDVVRMMRLANGMTQQELSIATGMPQEFISKIETGATKITLKTATRLAKALDCNPDFFFSTDSDFINNFIIYFEHRGNMKSNPYFEQAMAMVQAQAGVKMMSPVEMIAMVKEIAGGLASLTSCESGADGEPTAVEPACDPKKAIKQNSVTCLECGAKFKIIGKKHLATHGLTPDEYREKYGMKKGTPLVCKALAEQRREKMKSMKIWEKLEGHKP